MKKICIAIGVIVGSLYIAGAFGIGVFELHYGAKSMCEARQ